MSADTIELVQAGLRTTFIGARPGEHMRVVTSIDGGISGAIAWQVCVGDVTLWAAVLDLPRSADPGSVKVNRQALDLIELWRWLQITAGYSNSYVVERFMPIPAATAAGMRHATPDQAAAKIAAMEASNVRLAGTVGELRALTVAAAVVTGARVLASPTPAKWRSDIGLKTDADKEVYRAAARRLFVQLDDRLRAKTHHDRAEALLIGEYGKGAKS